MRPCGLGPLRLPEPGLVPFLDDFPPQRHLSRDLGIAYRVPEQGRILLTAPVVPALLRPDGSVRTEVLAVLVDETVGFVAVYAAAPDWASTANLALACTLAPVEPRGVIEVDSQVVKVGLRLVVVEAEVCWEGRLLAQTQGAFARVGRADRNVGIDLPGPDPGAVWEMGAGALDRVPFGEVLGLRVDGPGGGSEGGGVALDFGEYVINSSGLLHGGVVAALSLAAAEQAGGSTPTADSGPAVLTANVQFLSPGRVGPFEAGASHRASLPGGELWSTETRDVGGGQVMARGLVTTT